MTVNIKAFYHQGTFTLSYVVYDQVGGNAVIIDSALDFSIFSGKVWRDFADRQIAFVREKDLTVDWVLDTHAHADHLSAAYYLKSVFGGKTGVGQGVTSVQQTFKGTFNIPDSEFSANGKAFDHLFTDNETFSFGELTGRVLATPGHTSDSVTYLIGGNAFVGDTVFMPDSGTARCDFPGGCAGALFDSIVRLHQLPEQTKLWMCHDYQPAGRDLSHVTTVGLSKRENIHIREGVVRAEFIEVRETRDETLGVPKLLYPALQVNIRGGRFPREETTGKSYLKLPLVLDVFV